VPPAPCSSGKLNNRSTWVELNDGKHNGHKVIFHTYKRLAYVGEIFKYFNRKHYVECIILFIGKFLIYFLSRITYFNFIAQVLHPNPAKKPLMVQAGKIF